MSTSMKTEDSDNQDAKIGLFVTDQDGLCLQALSSIDIRQRELELALETNLEGLAAFKQSQVELMKQEAQSIREKA